MGLLDQVLGQVLGGGGASAQPSSLGGGAPGGLGGLLSGNRAPIAMALLALLASKHLNNGAGGYGSALHDMFSGGASAGGTISGGTVGSGSSSGGLLDKLSGMFGGSGSGTSPAGGGLGGMLGGGVTGGALAGGLGDLLSQFAQAGHGNIANSWVSNGPSAPVSPDQLSQVLNPNDVDELSRQTGLGRGDLLSQLSSVLPQVVDKLTPNGRLPSADEHSQWV